MSSLPLGKPYAVSPLIRGLRFVLFVSGIFYGITKHKMYSYMEANWRIEEAKRKVIRDKELAILKAKIAKEEREAVRKMESGQLFDEL